ncbi:hypothetical protein, partial [Vibrio parahaemolyticus]|uniref:hypothetical protein n=1 Tax=Vibrio parahaemolyticus TaxID=670 RepID=UPI0009EFEA02
MTKQNEELNGEDLLNEGQPDHKKIAAFVAMCILIIAGIGSFLWFSSSSPEEPQKPKTNHNIATTTTTSTGHSRTHAGRTFEFEYDQPNETPPPPTPKEVTPVETPK